jgi:hypothetical protein
MKSMFACLMVPVLAGAMIFACSGDDAGEAEFYGDFDLVNDFNKEDGPGVPAVPTSADSSDTAVWEVYSDWGDTDTTEAHKAGLAWGQNSGLNWNEKYALWIASLSKVDGHGGSYKTFEITNPQGKTIVAPVLECAEVAYFLRATFASWYHLPFFMEAVDSDGTRVFFGHFGWRTSSGRYKNSNQFKKLYVDYTNGSYTEANWPKDIKLRGKKLYGSDDDFQPFIGEDARAGAYFDELFLNKRVGHFLILFLSNFGSIHLADSANTFNIKPEAVREGDVLLERWQKRGIGHTLNVKMVGPGRTPGKLIAELASGSMPRRQPKWEDETASKRYFTLDATGGEGTNYDGDDYAKLGGGLKRWRVARAQGGYYVNTMLPEDLNNWISSTDYAAIAARPGQFEELLDKLDPEDMRDALLTIIEDKRAHLRNYPASCSARTGREEAFDDLYDLMQTRFYMGKLEVDKNYRKFEDYVFAELVYQQSKTCCWNSSTSAMYEIIMDFNTNYVREGGGCRPPVVFMNDNGYGTFRDYAVSLGRGSEWVDWSEDESCPQRGVSSDLEEEHAWTDFCTIADVLLGPTDCQDDGFEENDSRGSAAAIGDGTYGDLMICDNDHDWFVVSADPGTLTASIAFTHATSDLDMELLDAAGTQLDSSTGSGDSETVEYAVTAQGDYYIHVFPYSGARNSYSLTVTVP